VWAGEKAELKSGRRGEETSKRYGTHNTRKGPAPRGTPAIPRVRKKIRRGKRGIHKGGGV